MSRKEGTPNPILEASCSGIPWVSTDVGIVRELWDHTDGKGGIIVERRVDALVEAVRQCHRERGVLWERGAQGAKAVRDYWTWETRARSFDEAIRVAEGRGQNS
jgi:glycosyltransferase involved in cell wall biosynthesis